MSENKKAIARIETLQLNTTQNRLINLPTPEDFIETKPGRGGKQVRYVQGGYVIAKLNAVFGPLNWEFKISERGQTERKNESNAEGEVWVYGELAVIDHKNGFRVTKGQYGQHPIHKNVPLGDAFKAAGTDALKKCASLFGVALDVYWKEFDEEAKLAVKGKKKVIEGSVTRPAASSGGNSSGAVFDTARAMIQVQNDAPTLREWREKISSSDRYAEADKKKLLALIDAKLKA